MKKHRRVLWCAIFLAVTAAGLFVWQRQSRDVGRPALDGASPNTTAPPEEQKPVGWVFGRLMGFPGADRPLTTTTGPGNRDFAPPPSPPAGYQP